MRPSPMKRRFGSKIGIDWPLRDDEGDAAERRHRAERGDHRVDAAERDDQPVDRAHRRRRRRRRTGSPARSSRSPATASAMQTVDMPSTEPTEISSPPETITIVCALASTPRIAIAWPMLEMLRARKNTSGRNAPKIATRQASAISRLKLCVPIAWIDAHGRGPAARRAARFDDGFDPGVHHPAFAFARVRFSPIARSRMRCFRRLRARQIRRRSGRRP